MLDIKLIREHPEVVRENLKKRRATEKLKMLEDLIEYDKEWRQLLTEANKLRHKRKMITTEIASLKKKGKDMDHRDATHKERGISEYCFDYCFPGDEFGYKLTILAGKERFTGMKFATTVPVKGSSGKFAVDKCLEFIAEVRDASGEIIIKND